MKATLAGGAELSFFSDLLLYGTWALYDTKQGLILVKLNSFIWAKLLNLWK